MSSHLSLIGRCDCTARFFCKSLKINLLICLTSCPFNYVCHRKWIMISLTPSSVAFGQSSRVSLEISTAIVTATGNLLPVLKFDDFDFKGSIQSLQWLLTFFTTTSSVLPHVLHLSFFNWCTCSFENSNECVAPLQFFYKNTVALSHPFFITKQFQFFIVMRSTQSKSCFMLLVLHVLFDSIIPDRIKRLSFKPIGIFRHLN